MPRTFVGCKDTRKRRSEANPKAGFGRRRSRGQGTRGPPRLGRKAPREGVVGQHLSLSVKNLAGHSPRELRNVGSNPNKADAVQMGRQTRKPTLSLFLMLYLSEKEE